MPGVVSYPHGWDERRTAGVNINRLLSSAVEHKDSVSGASHLDGVPVRVESCTSVPIELPTALGRYEHVAARPVPERAAPDMNLFDLTGRVALVTGGSSGLGKRCSSAWPTQAPLKS